METTRGHEGTADRRSAGAGDDAPKDIAVFDAIGRRMAQAGSVTETLFHLNLSEAAKGLYWVRVSDGIHAKARRLLVQ